MNRWTLAWTLGSGVVALTACAAPVRHGPDERLSDASLAAAVKSTLAHDQRLYQRHIDVQAHDGVVQLSGQVVSGDEVDYAREDARSVSGVREVQATLGVAQERQR